MTSHIIPCFFEDIYTVYMFTAHKTRRNSQLSGGSGDVPTLRILAETKILGGRVEDPMEREKMPKTNKV